MKEIHLLIALVFETEDFMEPGESIDDSTVFALGTDATSIVWLKVNLRVESGDRDREWNLTRYIRVATLNAVSR